MPAARALSQLRRLWRLWSPGLGSFINPHRDLRTSLTLLGLSFAFGDVDDQVRWPRGAPPVPKANGSVPLCSNKPARAECLSSSPEKISPCHEKFFGSIRREVPGAGTLSQHPA